MTESKFTLDENCKVDQEKFVDDDIYQKTILKKQNYERSWMGEKVPGR